MNRILSTILAVSLFFSPLTIFAEEATSTQGDLDVIPVYFFASEEGEILGIVPITPDLVVGCATRISTSTAVEISPEIPPGVECILWDSDTGSSTPISEEGAGVGQRIFTGHEYDTQTGLSYMGARYQNGVRGQFLSQDPAAAFRPEAILGDPQQLNTYSYGRNNPLFYVDADGRSVKSYLAKSGNQVLRGNYTIDSTLLGLAGQIGLGLTGFDAPGDVRDVAYDVTHFGQTGLGQTALDAVGVLPIVGSLKYADEASETASAAVQLVKNKAAGAAFERLNGIAAKGKEAIVSLTDSAARRFPDAINHAAKTIQEIKNVNYQRFTNQLDDFLQYAETNRYKFVLTVAARTQLSKELQGLIDVGRIILDQK